jgi:hypothetical protein
MTDTALNPVDDELGKAMQNSARRAVSNNIGKNDFVAKMSGVAAQHFDRALHTENKRVLDITPQNNPLELCRISSAESDMHGRCRRCGSGAGEPCGDPRP